MPSVLEEADRAQMQLKVNPKCPRCHEKMTVALGEIAPGRTTQCPFCGATIRFSGDDGSKVQRAVDDLEQKVRDLNLKIRLKF